jgi:hypothetical protein
VGLCLRDGLLRGLLLGEDHRLQHGSAWRSCEGGGPLPCVRTQLAVRASAGCPATAGAHTLLSAGVTRRTPTCCGSVSWASSSLCQLSAVCGFPTVWLFVEVCVVDYVLSMGGGLVLVRGFVAYRAVGGGLRSGAALVNVCLDVVPLPFRSSSPTVAGCQLGLYPAVRDQWGGECVVGGVLPRINIGTDVWGESSIMTGVYGRW